MAEQPEIIMEEREELMVSSKGGKPTKKIAHFLNPTLSLTHLNPDLPSYSLPNRRRYIKCTFNGWRNPNPSWVSWINRLHSSYKCIWKTAGIYDAILSSRYKIVQNLDLFFDLAERWCCDTNTFVFPWGEATITLEDVMVLGGYSVLGDSASGFVNNNEFTEIEKKLLQTLHGIPRANQEKWMKHFMKLGGESGIEHEAFLSFWLSRFVLPSFPYGTIIERFFKFSILLARGIKIALVPMVLASIYRDLSLIKCAMVNSLKMINTSEAKKIDKDEKFDDLFLITTWAPLQLVQVWAWERFPNFRPEPISTELGEPRLARWNGVNEEDLGNARFLLKSAGDSFEWRPYCKSIDGFCRENEKILIVGDGLDEVKSMISVFRVCELVGMDTIEQYNPHRVARQFGFDQDIPLYVKRAFMGSDIPKRDLVQLAWFSFINPIKDEVLYAPSKSYEPQVTMRYLKWLRQSALTSHAAFDGVVRKKRSSKRRRRCQETNNVFNEIITTIDIDIKPSFLIRTIAANEETMPLGFTDCSCISAGAGPMGYIDKSNVSDYADVPPGFIPKTYEADVPPRNNLDIPPSFLPKSRVATNVGECADVPHGFIPKTDGKTGGAAVKPADVPPGFTPRSNVSSVPPSFELCTSRDNLDFPESTRITNLCAKKIEFVLDSEVMVKKEQLQSTGYTEPLHRLVYDKNLPTSPTNFGSKEMGLLKKAGEISWEHRNESISAEIVQNLDDSSSNMSSREDLKARIRQLETMIKELTETKSGNVFSHV